MSTYTPDRWVIVEFDYKEEKLRKVLASWYGGYLGSDSWKLSSGITETIEHEDRYEFTNYSGSLYVCHKGAHGMSRYTASIYEGWVKGLKDTGNTITLLEGV